MTITRIPVLASAFKIGVSFTVLDCARCATVFAITEDLEQRRRYDGANFYCPLGHSNAFAGEQHKLANELAETKKKLERTEARVQRYSAEIDRVSVEKAAIARSRSAIQGQLTKTRRRVTNGVCPSCNRTFQQLGRHMQSKHPDEIAASS